ncbi:unnamed protein product [Rotaria sp. Silwood2]|nr:unnamed protein product [Rotaria sp. Silwood2]
MDVDNNNATTNNQKSATNNQIQQHQQEPLLQNYNDDTTRRTEDQHERQVDYKRYQRLNGREQKNELYREFEEELWKELEKLGQQEEELKRKKKVWEEECLKFFLAADEYEQNYVEHVPQNTPVEEMNVGKSFQQQDVSMKQIENSKQYQQHTFKKCRGDRKAQRRRRRLRRKGFDPNIITELNNQKLNHQQQLDQIIQDSISNEMQVHVPLDQVSQSTQNKNKHHDSAVNESIKRKRNEKSSKQSSSTIDKSLSQLSISQPSPKKQKTINNQVNQIEQVTTNGTSRKENSKSKKQIDHSNDNSSIPDYLKVSNRIFRQMLIGSLEGADKIVKRLNTSEKINYIRQYTYLIHR